MEQKVNVWQAIKKNAVPIIVISGVLSFLFEKSIDYFLNWYLNRELVEMGARFTYNYTVIIFMPVFFVIFFIIVANAFKRQMNRKLRNIQEGKQPRIKIEKRYTWKDIFRDRELFWTFVLVAMYLTFLLYKIQETVVEWLWSLSTNYAISSLNPSAGGIVAVAVIISIWLVVLLQNTIFIWLAETKKGNRVLAEAVFGFGIITALSLIDISNIWASSEEIVENMQDDYALGLIIPFDPVTTLCAMITLLLAKKGWKYSMPWRKKIVHGVIIAGVSFIISFTPLSMVINTLLLALFRGTDVI